MMYTKPVHVPLATKHWKVDAGWRRLEDLCVGVFDCPHTTPTVTETGPYVVRSQDIRSGIFRLSEAGHVTRATYEERIARAEPRFGDLFYSREGTYFGIAAEMPAGVKVCLGQRMVLIRPDASKLNSRFLRYWLNSPVMARHIEGFRDGTVAERLNMPVIRGLPIPLFDCNTQSAIASILGALDDKIDLNRRMNETLEAMARAIFKDWFVDFGPTRAKMEGRAPYLAPDIWALFPDRLDEEGKPEGWENKALSEFFEIIGGGTPKTSVDEYWGGEIPWFSVVDTPKDGSVFVHNTEKSITKIGLEESSAQIISAGTTIISARGTVGNLAIAARQMTFNQSCYALCGKNGVGENFVFLAAQHLVNRLQSLAHGSVFSTITRQTFDALTLAMAETSTMSVFEASVAGFFAKMKMNSRETLTLAATCDLLLPKLMSGEIRVKDAEKIVEAAR